MIGSLPVIEQRLRPGGVLILDKLLWGNAVLDPGVMDADTSGVNELTRRVTRSPNWIASIVPIRDGLLHAWRMSES